MLLVCQIVLNGDYKVSLQYQEISSTNLLQVEDNFETSSKLPDDCFSYETGNDIGQTLFNEFKA